MISMNTVDEGEIKMIQNKLNDRPKKRLELKTSSEMFFQSLKRVVLQTFEPAILNFDKFSIKSATLSTIPNNFSGKVFLLIQIFISINYFIFTI